MKKIIKSAAAIVLSLSVMAAMLMGMTTVSMAAANSGEYVWIESAEMTRDAAGGLGTVYGAAASGGSAVVSWNTKTGLTANFTVSEGTYDIWFLGQRVADWASTLNWEIDGGASQGNYAISNYAGVGSVDGSYPENYWHKLNSQVYFTKGSHSIHIGAVAQSVSTSRYIQLYDAIVVVPSEMFWTPSGLTKPAAGQVAGNYTYIEGANFSNANGHYVANDVAGSDRGYAAKFYNSSDATFVSTTINYDFMVDKTDEYDIWVLGSQSVAWLGQYNWKLDAAESYNAFGTVMRQPYTWSVQGSTQPVCVYKVASGESITAGKHNIEFELLKRTAGNGSYNLIDTVMVVPTSYNWSWANGATVTAAMLSADQTTLSIGNTTSIKADFTLPIRGQSGSAISWSSSNEEIISINGGSAAVTRPNADEGDTEVTLTATITRDGSSVTKAFTVTVPKATLEVTTAAPYNIFQSNEEHKVTFSSQETFAQDTEITYEVEDYFGNIVISDKITGKQGTQYVDCVLETLPEGHYTVTATMDNTEVSTYIAVVKPLAERQNLSDTPFAMTTASLQFVNIAELNDYLQMLKLSGVSWVREHTGFSWIMNSPTGMTEPSSTHFKDYYLNGFETAGINVINMVYGAPTWQQTETDKGYGLPDDLMSYYNSWKTYATYFGDKIDMYEINNEPDGGYTTANESAAIYAASLKAAYIAVKDASNGTELKVSNAGLQHNKDYFFELAENDMFKYTDIYNDHAHTHAMEPIDSYYEPTEAAFDEMMDRKESAGASDTPIWVTEAGIGIENTEGTPLSAEKQKLQAQYLIANTIESLAHGTDKHFVFLANAYDENSRQWGITTEDKTPYPSYAAYAAMTATLGQGRFVGTVDTGNDNVKAYWFDSGENKVLALWSSVDADVTLNFGSNNVTSVDFTGKEEAISHSGTYTAKAENAVKYFVIDGEIPADSYISGEKTEILQPVSNELTKAERVVLLARFEESARDNARYDGYGLEASGNTISVQVYNFNNEAMTGTISGFGDGWVIENNSQKVTIPAMNSVTLTFNVKADKTYSVGKNNISFIGTFDGKETSKAVSKVHLNSYPEANPVKVHSLTLTYADGTEVKGSVSGGETVKLSLNAQSTNALEQQDIKLILAVYNSKGIVEYVTSKDMTTSWLSAKTINIEYSLPDTEQEYYIKAMVWNESLQPIIAKKNY